MAVKSNNTIFPIDENYLRNLLNRMEIELQQVSIRELNQVVNKLSKNFNVDFLHFEFGIPGLLPNKIGPKEEIRILQDKHELTGRYAPFDGVPDLKKSTDSIIVSLVTTISLFFIFLRKAPSFLKLNVSFF